MTIKYTLLLSAALAVASTAALAQDDGTASTIDNAAATHPDVSVKVQTKTPLDGSGNPVSTAATTTTTVTKIPHQQMPEAATEEAPVDPSNYPPLTDPSSQLVYVSGGVGQAEAAYFKTLKGDYTFKILMADKTGHLVSEATVQIDNAKGATVATLNNVGPYLLVKLPVGKYKITASANDATVAKTVTIKAGKLTAADVRF